MRISIDVICERLSRHQGISCEVVRRVRARRIEELLLADGRAAEKRASLPETTLLVTDIAHQDVAVRRYSPNLLLVVAAPEGDATRHEAPAAASQSHLDGNESLAEVAVARTRLPAAEVFALMAEDFAHLARWDARMLEAIVGHAGPADVLAIAAEELANPIALFDSTLTLVSVAGNIPTDASGSILGEVIKRGYSPTEYYDRDELAALERRFVADNWPATERPRRHPEHVNCSVAIVRGGKQFGSLGSTDLSAPFSPGQLVLIDLVRSRIEDVVSLSPDAALEQDDSGWMLRALVAGQQVDGRQVARRLELRGWSHDTSFCLFAAPLPSDNEVAQESLAKRLRDSLGHAVVTSYDAVALALFRTCDHDPASVGFERQLRPVLTALDGPCFVSEPFGSPFDLRAVWGQCRRALDEAERRGLTGIVRLSDVYEGMLARALGEAAPDAGLVDPRVLGLARNGYRGDVARGRELVGDLYAYLACGRNAHLAARTLYLHRNTLTYRLEVLGVLLGADIADLSGWQALYLQISCLIALEDA